ncbi:hypothetical protein HYU15_02665 [Candidatus Woesearchaeota archaeon]|nr:hypothetical protein [Candidatus Woesearchaeota archaeon]
MSDIETLLLLKLFRRKIWSHKMINESDLVNMVAKHLRGEARHALERLYREGLLNRKPGVQKEFRYRKLR